MKKTKQSNILAWLLAISIMINLLPLLPKASAEDINYIATTYDASEDVEKLLTAVGSPSDMTCGLTIPSEYVGYETTARAYIIDSEINNQNTNPQVYLRYKSYETSEEIKSSVKVDEGSSGWTTLSFTPTSENDTIHITYDGKGTSDGIIEICKLELQRNTLLPISALEVQDTNSNRQIAVQAGTATGKACAFSYAFQNGISGVDLSGHPGIKISFHAYMSMNGTGTDYTTDGTGLQFFAIYNDGSPQVLIDTVPNDTTNDTQFTFQLNNNASHLQTIAIKHKNGADNEWHISDFKIESSDPDDRLGKETPYDMMSGYITKPNVTVKQGQVYAAPISALRDIRIPIPSNYYTATVESPVKIIAAESVDPYKIRYEHNLFDIGLLQRNTLITVTDGEAVGQARSIDTYFRNGISSLNLQGHEYLTVSLDANIASGGIMTGIGLKLYAVYNDGSKSLIGNLPNNTDKEHYIFQFHNIYSQKYIQSLAIQYGTAGYHNVWHISNFKITDPTETVSTATEVSMGAYEARWLNECITLRFVPSDTNEALTLGGEFTETILLDPMVEPICTFIVEAPRVVSNPVIDLSQYTDLQQNAWYADAIEFVVNHQLMNGITTTQFAPNANANEKALYTVLYRLEENYISVFNISVSPRGEQTEIKADASLGSEPDRTVTTYNKLEWAILNNFMPNPEKAATDSVTRQETVITLYRYAIAKGADVSQLDDLSGFTDTQQCSVEGRHAFAWAVEAGIISGVSGGTQLSPNGTLTRAQLATMVYRFVTADCVIENQDHVHRYVVSNVDWRHARTDCDDSDQGLTYWYQCLDCNARSTYQYFALSDKYTERKIHDERMDHHSYTMRDPSPECQRSAATGTSCATYYFRCKNCGKIYNGSNANGYYNHTESAPNTLLPPQNTGSQGLFTNANQYKLTYTSTNYNLTVCREWHYDSWCYLAQIHFIGNNSGRFASMYTKTAGQLIARQYQHQSVSGYSVGQILVLEGGSVNNSGSRQMPAWLKPGRYRLSGGAGGIEAALYLYPEADSANPTIYTSTYLQQREEAAKPGEFALTQSQLSGFDHYALCFLMTENGVTANDVDLALTCLRTLPTNAAAIEDPILTVGCDYASGEGYNVIRNGTYYQGTSSNRSKYFLQGGYNQYTGQLVDLSCVTDPVTQTQYQFKNVDLEDPAVRQLIMATSTDYEGNKVTDLFQISRFSPLYANGAYHPDLRKELEPRQRCAIGQDENGDIWILVSDGSNGDPKLDATEQTYFNGRANDRVSCGLMTRESAELLVSKGCTLVLDLDGGGSVAMVYKYNGVQKVLNAMYGNGNWPLDDDRQNGRSISDFILIK